MEFVNWDEFKIKNAHFTNAFEEMCLHLFCRKFEVDSYDIHADCNHPGLEIKPIQVNNTLYSFQAKFHDPSGSGNVYDQLVKSFKNIKDKVDIIYIYTNADLVLEIKEKKNNDILKLNAQASKVERIAKNKGVKKIIWITKKKLEKIIQDNLDILQLFFGKGNEINLMNNSLGIDEKKFLSSSEFIDLPLENGETINSFSNIIIEDSSRIFLISGQPGSGKSQMMKKIFFNLSGSELELRKQVRCIIKNKILPIIIDLKLCQDDNLYRIIKEKLGDYSICLVKSEFRIIYILDGLDEITLERANKICVDLKKLLGYPATFKILISCRMSSYNSNYLNSKFKIKKITISKLKQDYIDKYFQVKNNKEKNKKLKGIKNSSSLLVDIDDIFSIVLLWDVIENIDETTTKVELIEMKIKNIIEGFDESKFLSPKQDYYLDINKDIAYIMQKNMQLTITIGTLQKIIMDKYERLTYLDINNIVNTLCSAFFEISNDKYQKNTELSYCHRIYQEYFLYLKTEELFFQNPLIVRELNVVSNLDFFIGIFLAQGLKKSLDNKMYINALSLYFLTAYLPKSCIKNYRKNHLLNEYSGFGIYEPSYAYSKDLIYTFAAQNNRNLERILGDKTIDIFSFLNDNNRILEFIEIFHKFNKDIICNVLIKRFKNIQDTNSNQISNIVKKNIYSSIYYYGNILRYKTDDLKYHFIDEYEYDQSLRICSFESIAYNNEKSGRAFLKYMLEFRIDDLITLIPQLDNYLFSIWCDEFLKPNNLFILFLKTELRQTISAKLKDIANYDEYDLSILIMAKFLRLDISMKNVKILERKWNEINRDRRYVTWDKRWNYNIALTYVLDKKDEVVFDEVKEYILIFEIMIKFLKNEFNESELLKAIDEKLRNEKTSTGRFKYQKSELIGIILSNINISNILNHYFVGNILRCKERIDILTTLYTLKINNTKAFKHIVNLELINYAYSNLSISDEYYDSVSELYLKYSFIKAELDSEGSYLLLLKSFNNSLFRAGFRKDDIVSSVLIDLLERITLRHCYNYSEMELFLDRTHEMLIVLDSATDGDGDKSRFEKLIISYYPSLMEKYNINKDSKKITDSSFRKGYFNKDYISKDNLFEVYCGKIKICDEIDYTSLDTWDILINKEIELTGRIEILMKFLDKVKYPVSYIDTNGENCYLAIAAVLKDGRFADEIMEYVSEKGGREGLVSMIKTYVELNDSIRGKEAFSIFFKLCELLVNF